MSILLLILAAAHADDGLDGHHFRPIPGWGEPLDLVETWTPEAQVAGSFGLGLLADASGGALVNVYEDWNGTTDTPLLDNVVALNVGLRVALARRLALTATGPLYLASTGVDGPQGAGIGDIRVGAPIGLLLPEGHGFGLGLVPLVDLPTGNADHLLGSGGLGVGALLAAGWGTERVQLDLNLGYGHDPVIEFQNHQGGSKLLANLGAGYALTEGLGLRGELVYERALTENIVPGSDSPGEALLSLRGHRPNGLSWTLGGGAGITGGAGAPAWRAFAGIGWAHIRDPNADPDLDGIVGSLDACPRNPETMNGWKDADGCPDALSSWSMVVQDEEGTRLVGATVTVGGQSLVTGADGAVSLSDRMPDAPLTGTVVAAGYVDGQINRDHLDEGQNADTLTLAWLPGTTRFLAHDLAGKPIAAALSLEGPVKVAPLTVGPNGRVQTVLPPGEWKVLAIAEGYGTEGRVLHIAPDKAVLTVVDFALQPPMAEIQKKEVVISEAVLFDFNADTLRPDSEPLLRQVAGVLLSHPEITKIEIQGHTDNVGDPAYNLDLSQRRVDAVMTWLVAQGVAPDRMVAKGYGESQPIQTNATDAGRAANRRVQFKILQTAP